MPVSFWKWAVLFIGAGIIFWWKLEEGEINEMKSELLARQRAVKEELGPRWFPLRDKIEGWTAECAADDFRRVEAPKLVKEWDFRGMNGIYLRLAKQSAKSPESIREAAHKSLHDGFTSCLLRVDNPSPIEGPACETTQDCPKEQLCNDYKHCAPHSQPYNLRTAYRTMSVMSDEWVANVQDVSNKLAMRGTVATFEATNKYDLPVAANLLQRAKYFLVVVDEATDVDAQGVVGALPEVEDAGAQDDRSIPTKPHKARVCIWRLEDDEKMLAIRGDASGALVGGPADVAPATRIARQRQANSCALALDVREAMGAGAGATVHGDPEPGSGGADAGVGEGGAGTGG